MTKPLFYTKHQLRRMAKRGISYGKRLFPDHPMEDHIEDLSEYEEV